MKSLNNKLVIYASLTWALTVFALAFRIIARIFSYDADIGYFETGEIFPILYHLSLILLAVLAASAFITFRRESIPDHVAAAMRGTCIAERIASIFAALCLLWNAIAGVLFYFVTEAILPSIFTVFGLLMGFLAVFFFLFFQIPSCRGTNLHMFGGFALILYFIYTAGTSYFDLYTPMNNPVKVLIQLTAIAAMLYLLSELRLYTGSVSLSRHLAVSSLAVGFLTVSAVSGGFFSVMTEEYTTVYHSYELVHLALLAFVVIRVVRLLTLLSRHDRAENAEAVEPASASQADASETDDAPLVEESTDAEENDPTPENDQAGSEQ